MATLLFSAIGTLVGGPIGGAIGALVGRQVDSLILPRGSREGPRLTELALTTSSYGMPIPRHFGRMRVAGTVIWATDLVEHRDKQGGGKGRPSTTTYSYSASFAVALSSRPLAEIGRIWADGKLLRGAAGDLKVAGTLRLHQGHADQAPDALIASAESPGCPAFRDLAYAVFEDLQLAEFGNRIPALTFEIVADNLSLEVANLLDGVIDDVAASTLLDSIAGLSCDASLAGLLATLDAVIPMDCNASGDTLTIVANQTSGPVHALGEAASGGEDGSFGESTGFATRRSAPPERPLGVLRYYDVERDYQPGAQRAVLRAEAGEGAILELPASLTAAAARQLVDQAARRADWSRQTLAWRSATLDPAIGPGSVVTVTNRAGWWKVSGWEWRAAGVELTLERLARHAGSSLTTDAGRAGLPPDLLAAPTILEVFELPWDGTGSGTSPIVYAAASSVGAGWSGAALFHEESSGSLQPLGPSGRTRAVVGETIGVLAPASPHLLDRASQLVVQLIAQDLELSPASFESLAQGANRALVSEELIQFAWASPLGAGRWLIGGLLRGRGGTEAAIGGHISGDRFVLLDGNATAINAQGAGIHSGSRLAAIGLADPAPVFAGITLAGSTLRPLSPVHGTRSIAPDGSLVLRWTRRARGAWRWLDGVDAPQGEQAQAYGVAFGTAEQVVTRWEVATPTLTIDSATWATLLAAVPSGRFAIEQIGSFDRSPSHIVLP